MHLYNNVGDAEAIKFCQNRSSLIISNDELDYINNGLPPRGKQILTSSEEILNIIQNRPNKKSFGVDEMPFFLIRKFSPPIMTFLTAFFNNLLANGYFPVAWKVAQIIPIPKPNKDNSSITNWRPISQLTCISKIYERVIANRVVEHINKLNILQNQFGFLKYHSTEHALGKIQKNIDNGLNGGMLTSLVALDLKAAFDVVWHPGLIYKMQKLLYA